MDEKSSSTHSGNRIDAAFDRLHAAYFGQLPLPWEEFEAAALEFFDGTPANAWDLLKDVVEFKQRFYPCRWASYEQARPGTFKLMPDAPNRRDLERDYDAMRVMIFGEVPQFARIIETLAGLEEEINHR